MIIEHLLEVKFSCLVAQLYEVYLALNMDKDITSHNSINDSPWDKLEDIVTMHNEFEKIR